MSDIEDFDRLTDKIQALNKELAGNKEELEILEINFQTLEEMYELKLIETKALKQWQKDALPYLEELLDLYDLHWPKKQKESLQSLIKSAEGE